MARSATHRASPGSVLSAVIALASAIVGGLVGLVAAVIMSVNFVIFVVGHPDGYEASPMEVLRYSPVGGVVNVLILIGGPLLGISAGWVIARRVTRGPEARAGSVGR